MAITDNRTLISNADTLGSWEDELGGTMGVSAGTNNFITGTGSIQGRSTKSTDGILWNYGSAQDLTNVVFYFWFNCTAAKVLATTAASGVTVRFTGATATDWFDIEVLGSDNYAGGWKMIVVDASVAKTASHNTNGTPPAITAIQRVGVVVTTTATAAGADPNFFVDSSWSLAANTPGIIVAGQNTGSIPWTVQDIIDAADVNDVNKAWGTIERLANGTVSINTPIQFGANDATVDEFEDTNEVLGWEDNNVPDGFYGFSGVAGTGQMDVTFGVIAGTGNDRSGSQGLTVTTGGPRWFMDFSTDVDIDSANFGGCTFIGGEIFDLDDPAVVCASVAYVNCNKAHVSNSAQVACQIVTPNTADGVAFMDTDDIGDIANCTFTFSDGHGVEILSGGPSSQNNVGNTFLGAFGGTPGDNLVASSGSTDAMIYNNAAAARTFNRSGGGTQPSFRNGASATSDDVAAVTITLTPLIVGSTASVYLTGTSTLVQENTNTGASWAFSVGASIAVDIVVLEASEDTNDAHVPVRIENVSFTVSQDFAINQVDALPFKG